MPSSRPYFLTKLCEDVLNLNPKSVLDVGAGDGAMGVLFRRYTDIWNGYYKKDSWKTTIDCVEGFAEYLTPLHHYTYNNIFISNVKDMIIGKLPTKYDLIFLGDIIEHFDKQDGVKIIEDIKSNCKYFIVITPLHVMPQNDVFDNELERHLSQWSMSDFAKYEVLKNEISGNAIYLLIKGDLN